MLIEEVFGKGIKMGRKKTKERIDKFLMVEIGKNPLKTKNAFLAAAETNK